jgi:hypothetical protein
MDEEAKMAVTGSMLLAGLVIMAALRPRPRVAWGAAGKDFVKGAVFGLGCYLIARLVVVLC